jgi:hypothetical protein
LVNPSHSGRIAEVHVNNGPATLRFDQQGGLPAIACGHTIKATTRHNIDRDYRLFGRVEWHAEQQGGTVACWHGEGETHPRLHGCCSNHQHLDSVQQPELALASAVTSKANIEAVASQAAPLAFDPR